MIRNIFRETLWIEYYILLNDGFGNDGRLVISVVTSATTRCTQIAVAGCFVAHQFHLPEMVTSMGSVLLYIPISSFSFLSGGWCHWQMMRDDWVVGWQWVFVKRGSIVELEAIKVSQQATIRCVMSIEETCNAPRLLDGPSISTSSA